VRSQYPYPAHSPIIMPNRSGWLHGQVFRDRVALIALRSKVR
jgi:hypothetical protein